MPKAAGSSQPLGHRHCSRGECDAEPETHSEIFPGALGTHTGPTLGVWGQEPELLWASCVPLEAGSGARAKETMLRGEE